jgi:hypothetical protein
MTGTGFRRPQGDDLPALTSTPGRLSITPQTPGKRPWAGVLAGMQRTTEGATDQQPRTGQNRRKTQEIYGASSYPPPPARRR